MDASDFKTVVEKQSSEIHSLIETINHQLDNITKESLQSMKSKLVTENNKLKDEVRDLQKTIAQFDDVPLSTLATNAPSAEETKKEPEPPKQKAKAKEKEAKPSKPVKTNPEDSLPVDVSRLDFRIGHIVAVEKHPDADTLYVEKVDVNEDQPRTVVSGLVRHMTADELQDQMVVLLCNLKPAKMRGITSEAMVMCASTPEKVEVLIPPKGCVPGDLVEFEGYPRVPDAVLNPKKKIFETCAPDLKTDENLIATYKNVPFVVPGKGKVVAKTLANVQIK